MSDAKNTYIKEKKRRYAISLATLASKPTKRLSIVNDGAVATLAKVSSDFFPFLSYPLTTYVHMTLIRIVPLNNPAFAKDDFGRTCHRVQI